MEQRPNEHRPSELREREQMDQKRAFEKILQASLCMTRQCWEQGMLSYALLECLGRSEKKEPQLKDLLEMIVYDMVLRQSSDGRLCNVEDTPAVTDSAFCIPAVLAVGEMMKNEAYVRAAHANAEYLLHDAGRTAKETGGILYHMRGTQQIWADSAAFLPYALVITGHPVEGYDQMIGILDRLYLPETGLYAHIWDEGSQSWPDRNAWSIGIGWILTGLERTWQALPADMVAQRKDLREKYLSLLEKVLPFQQEDGGFHDVMDDPGTYMETEAPCMIACGIYAGMLDGMVEKEAGLLSRADAMCAYVCGKTLADGRVADAASSPAFDRPGTAVECQAHALMMLALKRATEVHNGELCG